MVSCWSGWLATLNIVSSQFKSHPSGLIPLNYFLESPRVLSFDRSCLSYIPLHSALFCLRPRISNITYMQMTHRSITPSTHPVWKIYPKPSKLTSISPGLKKNKLKLNPEKTKFLLIGNNANKETF